MKEMKTYACYNRDNSIRMGSSSGGIFSLLAKGILSHCGIVYGVAMTEDCYSAEFIRVTDVNNLPKLRGSKYLQARMGNTFKRVKDDLTNGKIVLFAGTGCQVNGLKRYLGKDYEKLICLDFICHGVPSPRLWKQYVEYVEEKNKGKVISTNFRCKNAHWSKLENKDIVKTKKRFISKDDDLYMQMFLKDICLRPSCYKCIAKKIKMSDVTIADFWGIEEIAPEMDDGKGTSLLMIRTEKGKKLFEYLLDEIKFKEVTYENGVRYNPSEYKCTKKPEERNIFFYDMNELQFEELVKKYLNISKMSFGKKIFAKGKRWGKGILQALSCMKKSNEEYGILFIFSTEKEQ